MSTFLANYAVNGVNPGEVNLEVVNAVLKLVDSAVNPQYADL